MMLSATSCPHCSAVSTSIINHRVVSRQASLRHRVGAITSCSVVSNKLKEVVSATTSRAAATLLAFALAASPLASPSYAYAGPSPSEPVYDSAGIIAVEKEQQLSQQLIEFERESGWAVRVYTSYGLDNRPTDEGLRAVWGLGKRTVVVAFNPGNPNLTTFYWLGDEALMKLRRPFWQELQSRYGNMFYVREQGEQSAIIETMSAIRQCLGAPEGCRVVPGLPEDQYYFTLALSIAGGLVLGATSLIPAQGIVQRQWGWALIFSPLWAILFINFGLGPVVTRTEDTTPVAANTAAFLATAATVRLAPLLQQKLKEGPSS